LLEQIQDTAPVRSEIYENFAKPVIKALDKMNIEYEMRARVKSIYSIWKKMEAKNIELSEIYDFFAVRIIFEVYPGMDEKKQCWDIYSAITDIYKLRPDRIRDWVSHPKANGYQALHLTVMGPNGRWIEIQIRSRRMDDIAEKGFAAHWKYKENKVEEDNELEKWLKTVQEILANPNPNAIDFLDTVKMNLFASEIFVFTPRGEIKTLPQGATALDFAYTIHTRVGDHCLGAKINHTLVPLSEKLKSGDQIEILTSQTQQPKPEWLNFVTTAKARTKIESSLRRQRRAITANGEEMLKKLMGGDSEVDNDTYNKILNYFNIERREDLHYAIGNGEIELPESKEIFLKQKELHPKQDNLFMRYMKQAMGVIKKAPHDDSNLDKVSIDKDNQEVKGATVDVKKKYVLAEEAFKKNFIVASCCSPLPGDDVFGFVTDTNEVEVHKRSCATGIKLKSSFGGRIVEVEWGDYKQYSFLAAIAFTGIDRMGILSNILSKLSEDVVLNIQSVNVSSKDGIFEGVIHVLIHSVDDVSLLSNKIAKVDGISTVHRALV
ncbi:MAG: bifunctional (p)ppGpp synthetase/guanosine-3',5'-bis(diphosphate) 3'-pyrophosphohydrolase, partial [Proteiniphilum sp.]|nr:bifunctional (p)ppGpp synthetase/guanosine-3',5'-bis(diphosphate) 3'-pyrophosphohydrolase [Proteiniphilum sp.]